ncbi:hypothetical protein EPUS_05599 [Endocarpon pusillum Z07020]|uniref:Very-long-chain (3R)-3-hydroxyacyl-CoA dehydratase n=1 Tax=Endocarpon pusillum (strain Z07020 / HMAS-L-300199) TaxID=1263415 RepID=U1G369_ENDPU|nr:uncharacterized protein EPUS_05599 [Endocarpon pusillum Z07020]ERF71727.1 hypothetical protein EPUS_05599 [Endocarpon pusillum Z07020]
MEDAAYPNTRRAQPLLSRKNYFLAYNGVCLVLWSVITLRAIFLIPILFIHDHLYGLHEALHPLLAATQSIAVLEVLHSLVGIVRASPLTTAMQVASRLLLVWGVVGAFPEIVVRSRVFGARVQHYPGTKGGPYAYAGILLAWGITECIRYGFFVWKEDLGEGRVPKWLTWLRYNTFFVLYPLGISSECWLIYCALEPAAESMPAYNMALKTVLLIYVPGKQQPLLGQTKGDTDII